jgi:hypothetical protein
MILLRADASAKNIMREEIMGRHYLFWLRPEGLRHVFSWILFIAMANAIHEITRTQAPKSHEPNFQSAQNQ